MNILLTNDDGYKAKGIRALYRALKEEGHRVVIVAPKENMSTVSRALTSYPSLSLVEEDIHSVDGTPADSILLALRYKTIDFEPDVVISGINSGFNLSLDIVFSGTCAAAAEAVSLGYKAIAISAEADSESALEASISFINTHLKGLVECSVPDTYISINVPGNTDGRFFVASPSMHQHRGPVDFSDRNSLKECDKGSDKYIVKDNCISISSIEAYPMESLKGQNQLEAYRRQVNGC